jgi:beta-glucanase (GH16 family)
MKKKHSISVVLLLVLPIYIFAQEADPYEPDFNPPPDIPGMKLVWHDEFNNDGRPDTSVWIYENGFVRNRELQWYQPDNAYCARGMLTIEGQREKIINPGYVKGSKDWRKEREYADYSSASIQTRGHRQWLFGRFEIRARIDTSWGSWPAIWTLGINKRWPANGEIDIMEFYRVNRKPVILANFAWGTGIPNKAEWDDLKKPLSDFIAEDPHWPSKFHVWRMDWNEDSISLYLDDKVLNTTSLKKTVNPDGFNPFLQQHYLLLNLAIGANGGDPGNTMFPLKYEVDYVRVYQYK